MDGQRKQPRRSARKNKDQRQQNIGTATQTNDETNNEGWRAFMEAHERYETHHEHTENQCKSMINSHVPSIPTQKTSVPSLGITIPTPIVAGGVSAELLQVLEQDYLRARRAGASGAASDVGASSWRARDHKKMEGAVVGPGLGNRGGNDDDDVTSVAVSDDTISVGSGYTVRPDEEVVKSPSSSLHPGPTYMERIKLGSSYLLGLDLGPADFGVLGDAMRATRDAPSSAIGGNVGEKRTFASLGPLVTPFGQSSAKRLKLSIDEENAKPNRVGWNGLDPNLLHDVFSRLNLREKVRCMGKVCRAWNELRSRLDLFADLSDESGPNATDMRKLLKWIPSSAISGVTGIRCHVRKLDMSHPEWMHRDDDFNARKALEYLAESIPDNTLSGIRTIIFSGPGIEIFGLLGRAAMLGIGSALRSLTLDRLSYDNAMMISDGFKYTGKDGSEIIQLLEGCEKLEELKIPSLLLPKSIPFSSEPVPSLLSIIGPPGTVATDLKVLDLTMSITDQREETVRNFYAAHVILAYTKHCLELTLFLSAHFFFCQDLEHRLRWNLEDIDRFCRNLRTIKLPRRFEDMVI